PNEEYPGALRSTSTHQRANGESGNGAGAAIAGRVTVEDGHALPSATLTLIDASGRQAGHTTTDAAGGYLLYPPAPGDYIVIAACHAHHPRPVRIAVTAQRHHTQDFVLAGGTAVTGRVLREPEGEGLEPEPLGGVVLVLCDTDGQVIGTTSTDRRGRYTLRGLTEGTYTLTAGPAALAPATETIHLRAQTHTEQDLVFSARAALSGTVRSAVTDRALPEALVTLSNGDGGILATDSTDTDGRFRFTELPADASYTITASGYPPSATAAPLSAGEDAQLTLHLGPSASSTDTSDADAPAVAGETQGPRTWRETA
ncbi:MAG: carboxypeptidase regulatory-like domain-containing protein, partial [Sciscionella sp.]